jgi:hypothetical protein
VQKTRNIALSQCILYEPLKLVKILSVQKGAVLKLFPLKNKKEKINSSPFMLLAFLLGSLMLGY